MVTMTKRKGSSPVVRNWKCAPSGIEWAVPGRRVSTSSRSPWRRHSSPRPLSTYHSSSTVLWVTASDTPPTGRVQWTMLPRPTCGSSRISEPSGATTSISVAGLALANSAPPLIGRPPA